MEIERNHNFLQIERLFDFDVTDCVQVSVASCYFFCKTARLSLSQIIYICHT